jgi:hypothetical protein
MSKYSYLKKYQAPHDHVIETWRENSFITASNTSILAVEKNLNILFPSDLKDFWLEIGGGNLTAPKEVSEDYECYYANNFLFPDEIALILTEGAESGLITEEVLEYIDEEELPFFEICDHSSFLYIRPNSDKPNAVYGLGGDIVEDSIETFIWKLYHVSPTYYLDKL